MRINTKVCYALRLMADISKFGQGVPVPLRDIAERQHLSKLYLSQLASPLKNASLLKSVWGNKGGYMLARPASEIRMLDIVHAVYGPIALMGCLLDTTPCDKTASCKCAGIWHEINEGIIKALSTHTLEDLIHDSSQVCACNGCQTMQSGFDPKHIDTSTPANEAQSSSIK
jgi:Rrf2 family protein